MKRNSLLALAIILLFALSARAEEPAQPELFPGVYLIDTQWHHESRELVYFLFDENVSVVGWSDDIKILYLTALSSGLTPAVYLNKQQVNRLIADITIVFVSYDKNGMPIGTLKFTKATYLKWFWFNTL